MRCAMCGYVRTRLDPLPDTHCPDCGHEYSRAEHESQAGRVRVAPERLAGRGSRRSGIGIGLVALFLFAAVLAGLHLLNQPYTAAQQSRSEHATMKGVIPPSPSARPQVVMYATSWCPYCAKARRFFASHGIPYTEYDIELDSRAHVEYQRVGGGGVPIILVGEQVVHGFDERRLRRALEPWLQR